MQPVTKRVPHRVDARLRPQTRARTEALKYCWQAIVYRLSYVLLVPIVWLLDRLMGDRFWKPSRPQ